MEDIPHLSEIAALVAARTGIDPLKRDRAAFARRVADLAPEGGEAALLSELVGGGRLFDRLVESLVVGETRFFRDPDQYAYLRDTVLPETAAALADAIMPRVLLLSVGCSTGQEAWSLGAALLDRRDLFPAETEFRVVGIDLSAGALEIAQRGEYGPDERRGLPEATSAAWFVRTRDAFAPCAALRRIVSFRRGNLLDPAFPGVAGGRATALFLKNVLFYFQETAAERALETACSLVAEGGILALAPSETRRGTPAGFREIHHGAAILYRRSHALQGASRP